MVGELIALRLSLSDGLDFVFQLAFILIFFLFLWYVFKEYKSEIDREKHNAKALLFFLTIIFGINLFLMISLIKSPEDLSLDKIILAPIFIIVFLVGALIVEKIRKNQLNKHHPIKA